MTGVITLPDGVDMCMPGDNVEMDVELITPIAIEEGLRLASAFSVHFWSAVVTYTRMSFLISSFV